MRIQATVLLGLLGVSLALRRASPKRGLGTTKSEVERQSTSKGVHASVFDCDYDEMSVVTAGAGQENSNNDRVVVITGRTRGRESAVLASVIGVLSSIGGIGTIVANNMGSEIIAGQNMMHPTEIDCIMVMIYYSYFWVFSVQLFGNWCETVLLLGNPNRSEDGPCSTGRSQAYILYERIVQKTLKMMI